VARGRYPELVAVSDPDSVKGCNMTNYNNLSELAAAAETCDCTAHMHINELGKAIYSVGNSDCGGADFDCYHDALAWATERGVREAGLKAEEAGGAIGSECLDELMNADGQALRIRILQGALLDLQRLPNPKRL